MLGFGSKKNRGNKKDVADQSNDAHANSTECCNTDADENRSDTNNGKTIASDITSNVPFTPTQKKKRRLSLDLIATPTLFKKSSRKPLHSVGNSEKTASEANSTEATAKPPLTSRPEITLSMITETKQRLRSTSSLSGSGENEETTKQRQSAPFISPKTPTATERKQTKPNSGTPRSRVKVSRDVRYVERPSDIPVRTPVRRKPGDANARKPPLARRKLSSGQSTSTSPGSTTSSVRQKSRAERNCVAYNIRHAGSTPPRVSRRDSVKTERRERTTAATRGAAVKLNLTEDTPQITTRHHKKLSKVAPTPGTQQVSNAYNPDLTLQFLDETVHEDQGHGKMSNNADVIPLSADDLAALDVATNFPTKDSLTLSASKRESLVEAMRKSPLLSPECHQVPPDTTSASGNDSTDDKSLSPSKRSSDALKKTVEAPSNGGKRQKLTKKSSKLGLRLKRFRTPQPSEMLGVTPTSHRRAALLKRSHSTSTVLELRRSNVTTPVSLTMLTPLSSVAEEMRGTKAKKRKKDTQSLEQIVKDYKKREAKAAQKPPPKPPRKNPRTSRSRSRSRTSLAAAANDDTVASRNTSATVAGGSVKRKSSFRDMFGKRPPPQKPARRSAGALSLQGADNASEQSFASADDVIAALRPRSNTLGENVRRLRRKLSRSGDLAASAGASSSSTSPPSSARVMSAKAGHTPKAPRGKRDERLV